MKTHHQNTWQFAKLFLAALVFAFGVVACGGGGGGSSTNAGITPATKDDWRLAIKSVSIEAVAAAPVESNGAGTLSARSAFVIAANADFILSVTVENTGKGTSPANTSFVLYRSDDKATLEEIGDVVGTYAVGAVGGESERVITQVITDATLSADSTKPTRFIVEGQFADETVAADGDDEAVSNDYLGVEVYTDADGSVVNEDVLITGNKIVDVIDYDWSATGATASKTSSVATGEKITLTIDVTNTIASRAPRALLVFYRSTDTTIDNNDASVITFSIRPLAAGATSKVSTDVFAPLSLGTYYYGACVVSADDSVSSNDCSAGVAVSVTEEAKYGAFAYGEDDYAWYAYTSVNQATPAAAHRDAIQECSFGTTINCSVLATFTAHIAYAVGAHTNGDDGVLAWATRNNLQAAKSAALSECRRAGGQTSGEDACKPYEISGYLSEPSSSHSNSPAVAGAEAAGSQRLDFDDGWDFEIELSVSDSTLTPSQAFTLSALVGNWEFAEFATPATTLTYYRSSDPALDSSDTQVGTDSVPVLSPGRTSSENISLTAPSAAGSYYYIACVPDGGMETWPFDNCDYVSVTVSSSGGGGGGSTTGGTCSVGQVLAAGDSCTLSGGTVVSVNAGGTQVCYGSSICGGTGFNVGGVSVSKVTGGYRIVSLDGGTAQNFDLSVTAFSVNPSSVVAGAEITFTATVANASSATASSPATTLRYYRSTNSTISASDTQVATDSVGALAASATSNETASVSVPSSAGTYYYGACVAATGDSNTGNNCSAGSQVVVTASVVPTTFDLSVTAFSVSKSSIVAGEAITLNATVTNASSATASSPVATLKYYRSSDATITSADTEVGVADSIGALAPAVTKTETATDSPTVAGTYYYGACVDGGTLICSAGVRVDVAARDFDLSVTAFSVSKSSIVAGEAITLNATVTNDSSATASSPVAALKYYRSTDATIDATDTEVGTADSISVLAAAATSAQTATDSPSTAGTFYYGACVVGAGDSDTSNDCSAGAQVDVAARDFDLSVTAFSVAPSSVVAGNDITFSVTVGNVASAMHSSPAATLRYYRSTDVTIDATDTEVGVADSIGALAAAATESETAIVYPRIAGYPSTAGTYYYGACVVGTGDSDTTNNCSAGAQVVVATPNFDLSVTAFSVSKSSIVTGEAITLNATVTNDSSANVYSPVAALRYYRSSDAIITSTDTEVGTADSISALAAAATESETATDSPSTAGTYYYGACVVGTGDSDTTNNCSAGAQVVVAAPDFDLSVTAFSVSKSSIVAGEAITLNATVTNDSSATTSSSAATLRYYRSSDATITSTDTEVGTADSISALAAAATETETATDSPSTAGTYYYGACVVGTGDSDTTNNCSAGAQVDVAARDFDLSVTAFSVSKSSIVAGEAITLNATVTNDSSANVSSPVATLRYYRSSDATITSTDTEVGTADSIGALVAAATESETATDSPSTAGTYYYGACVVGTGDSDTTNNCSAGRQVVVATPNFDLSVTAFTVSNTSVVISDSITLRATVGNDSSATVSSPATTLRYYRSTNSTITASDTQVATDSVGALAASATSNETASVTVPSSAGTYYYGACVAATGDSDTGNNCSTGVRVTVAADDGSCKVGDVLSAGDSCTLSNGATLSVNSGGSLCAGNACFFRPGIGGDAVLDSNINGVFYTATLTRISSSSYRIVSL